MKTIIKNKKGFTLAELLIVVAIIGVLVAVSIPIFTAQLKKARLATNQANARAAKAAAVAEYLLDSGKKTGNYDCKSGTYTDGTVADGTVNVTTDVTTWIDVKASGDYAGLTEDVYDKIAVTLDNTGAVTRYSFSK